MLLIHWKTSGYTHSSLLPPTKSSTFVVARNRTINRNTALINFFRIAVMFFPPQQSYMYKQCTNGFKTYLFRSWMYCRIKFYNCMIYFSFSFTSILWLGTKIIIKQKWKTRSARVFLLFKLALGLFEKKKKSIMGNF